MHRRNAHIVIVPFKWNIETKPRESRSRRYNTYECNNNRNEFNGRDRDQEGLDGRIEIELALLLVKTSHHLLTFHASPALFSVSE